MTDQPGDYLAAAQQAGAECLAAALEYLALGWSVLAVCPPDHMGVGRTHGRDCVSPGKAPWGEWKEFQDRLPTEDEIRGKWCDNAVLNVGLALGPVSGLVRVDVDGAAGEAMLLAQSGGDLPATLEFRSGRTDGTGRGLLYAIPTGVVLRTTPRKADEEKTELRFQAKGAQTVLPPSRHGSGSRYAWLPGHGPNEIEAAPMPAWLLAAMAAPAETLFDGRGRQDGEPGAPILDGTRNSTLTSLAGTMRNRGMTVEEIYAGLWAVNEGRCKPPKSADAVWKIAQSVSRYDPDPFAGVTIKLPAEPGTNGQVPTDTQPTPYPFRWAVPASELKRADEATQWLVRGLLARGETTLFSALWKAGKTTLMAHLLKTLGTGGSFCGLPVAPARVYYVTEEHESLWAERRDLIGITDHVKFLVRPFGQKPKMARWLEFMAHLREERAKWPYDLLVFDPISNLWPVGDENDAPQVQAALMPLHSIGDDLSTELVHHLRKGDGTEATGHRGSGALMAFCDTLLELRRYAPGDRKDCRRVLTGYGRHVETPDEVVVELTEHGYTAHGDRGDVGQADLAAAIRQALADNPGWLTRDQVAECLPDRLRPGKNRLGPVLDAGVAPGWWLREGTGERGSPYRYRGASFIPPPLDGRDESEHRTF